MSHRPLLQRIWYKTFKTFVSATSIVCFQARYTGRQNIPRTGGVLMVANHQSYLDPAVIGAGCPRIMNYLARKPLFKYRLSNWFLGSLNAIPIDQEGSGLSGIKESLRRLKRGEILLVFPEGARCIDGEMGPFYHGFATLAVRTGVSILPAAIEGAFEVWPRSQWLPILGRIHVHYGLPMLPDEIKQYQEPQLLREVQRRVRDCLEQLRQHPRFAQ